MEDVSTPKSIIKRKMDDRSPTDSESPELKKFNVHDTAFSEMVTQTFKDKVFIQGVTPILYELLNPFIKDCINSAVSALKESVIKPLIDSNKELMETVKFQSDTIEEQKRSIDLKSQKLEELEGELKFMHRRVESLSAEANDLEQYSRRNSLRLYNLPVPDDVTSEEQLTDIVVRFINANVLKLSNSTDPEAIVSQDIERCHFTGRGKRQLLIKFVRYHTKRRIYLCKKNLKQNPNKIFISEDLTKANHNLVMDIRDKFKQRAIFSFWTRDGAIFVKKRKDDSPVRVHNEKDIRDICTTRP
ncbi:MAG: hypothetical protein AB2693_11485 [Candidatus Thiodiazotropha sp.]